ncbi:MAG: isochorismatase family protein [Comamonas sp.]|nr:isochorismatase family protein [Comamonas sp.]
MLLECDASQLLLVDYQDKLMPAIFEGQAALGNALRLAQAARLLQVPVWGTEQNPDKLGPNAPALKALCDRSFSKMSFSAAVESSLLNTLLSGAQPANAARQSPSGGNARSLPKHLRKEAAPTPPERPSIVIAGCEAHVCLLQTALSLLEQEELEVWVVTDACSSRTERNRDAAFDRLAGAGAELVTTEMVVFEWLRDCQHPAFRQALALIK